MTIRGIAVLIVLLFISLGFSGTFKVILNLFSGIFEFLICLKDIPNSVWSFLGISDFLTANIVFYSFLIILGIAGIFFSQKSKKKIYMIISSVVSFVSVLCLFDNFSLRG